MIPSSSSEQKKVCIGTSKKSEQCTYVHQSNDLGNISQSIENDTLVFFMDSYAVVNQQVYVTNKKNIQFQGASGATTISCNTNNSGLFFNEIQNLVISNLKLYKCGTTFGGTSRILLVSKAAVFIVKCINIQTVNFTIDNSLGTGMAMFGSTGNVDILNSSFTNNSITQHNNESGGGGLYIEFSECSPGWEASGNQCNKNAAYHIHECEFLNNSRTTYMKFVFTSELTLDHRNGHGGGGLTVWARGHSFNNSLTISNSIFHNNSAHNGGGIYFYFQQNSTQIKLSLMDVLFKGNIAYKNGGAMSIESMFSRPNMPRLISITAIHCAFEENKAYSAGGGVSVASSLTPNLNPNNTVVFTDCQWTGNQAIYGVALNLLSLNNGQIANHFALHFLLSDCNFTSNKLFKNKSVSYTGVIYAEMFPMRLSSKIKIMSNEASGIYAINSMIKVLEMASITFCNNHGSYGGGISLIGLSVIDVQSNVTLKFIDNHAIFKGGAIYSYSVSANPLDRKCFINYKPSSSFVKPKLHFKGNKALLSSNSRSLYLSSAIPCKSLCNRTNMPMSTLGILKKCIGSLDFTGASMKMQVATQGYKFLKITRKDSTNVIPGKVTKIPIRISDEFGANATEALRLSLIKNSNKRRLSLTNSYTSNKKMQIYGQTNASSIVNINSINFRNLDIQLNIILSECPPGFIHQRNIWICSAQIPGEKYFGILKCDLQIFVAFLNQGVWAGYTAQSENTVGEENFYTSICPYGYCSFDTDVTKLPPTASKEELNKLICGGKKRTGILCGDCVDGHSVYFHSWEYQCGHTEYCNFGLIFYFLSEILPVTLMFTFIVLTGINFNSGQLNGFILYAQMILPILIGGNGATVYNETERRFFDFSLLLYSPFNLNFFKIESLSFCIFNKANFLIVILMEFFSLIYALVLVISLVYLMRSRCCYKLQIVCFKRGIMNSTSLTHGLSAFLILCYSQTARLCYQILNTSTLRGKGEKPFYPLRVHYMGTTEYFTGVHLGFSIAALLILVTFVAIPPLLLIAYPMLYKIIPQKILQNKALKIILSKLDKHRPLFDIFQGCFNDRHRYFAGLYFVYRSVFGFMLPIQNSRIVLYLTNQIILLSMLSIHLWIQPYKKRMHNLIDGGIFFLLSVINLLNIWRYFLSFVQARSQEVLNVGVSQLFLIFLPASLFVLHLIWKLFKFLNRFFNITTSMRFKPTQSVFNHYKTFSESGDMDENRTDINIL